MKKILLITLAASMLVSCTYPQHDKLVKDADGNVYRIKGNWRCNECYELQKINVSEIDSLLKR
jgi:hypothetical protein